MKRLIVTNEIASALLNSEISEYEKSLLAANPKNFLFTLLKMDFEDDVKIKVLCNDKKVVHLSLPYYGNYDLKDSTLHLMGDAELQQAVGGVVCTNVASTPMTGRGSQGFTIANRQFSDDLNNNEK